MSKSKTCEKIILPEDFVLAHIVDQFIPTCAHPRANNSNNILLNEIESNYFQDSDFELVKLRAKTYLRNLVSRDLVIQVSMTFNPAMIKTKTNPKSFFFLILAQNKIIY